MTLIKILNLAFQKILLQKAGMQTASFQALTRLITILTSLMSTLISMQHKVLQHLPPDSHRSVILSPRKPGLPCRWGTDTYNKYSLPLDFSFIIIGENCDQNYARNTDWFWSKIKHFKDKFLLRVIAREGIRVILARTCAIFYDG